jgi:hypothetical protein
LSRTVPLPDDVCVTDEVLADQVGYYRSVDRIEAVDDVDERLVILVDELIALTFESKIDWGYDGAEEGFIHTVSEVEVRVYARDHAGRSPFVLELRDSERIIEKLITSEPQNPVQQQLAGKVGTLYTVARRQAFHVGSVVDMLITQLAARRSTE